MIDIFVNKTVFYKQVAGLLEEVLDNIKWTKKWAGGILESKWLDSSIIQKINHIIDDNESALEGLRKLYAVLEEENKLRVRTKRNLEFKQIERLSVIKGGLYVSPVAKAHEALSDKFKKFIEEENKVDTQ